MEANSVADIYLCVVVISKQKPAWLLLPSMYTGGSSLCDVPAICPDPSSKAKGGRMGRPPVETIGVVAERPSQSETKHNATANAEASTRPDYRIEPDAPLESPDVASKGRLPFCRHEIREFRFTAKLEIVRQRHTLRRRSSPS